MADAQIALKLPVRIFFLKLLPVALAVGSVAAAGQERKDVTSGAGGAVVSAGTSEARPVRAAGERIEAYPEPEFVGVYCPNGKFKTTSKRDRFSQLGNNKPSREEHARRVEVPAFVDLRPVGRVVEDYVPPAHARKALEGRSVFANLRDEIVAFVYGREPILRAPAHVTTDSRQRLIVSDPDQPAVHVLDGKDSFRIVGGPQRRLQHPNGVAADAASNIYVADAERGMILVYDPQGRFLRYIGSFRGESMFANPTGIAIDRKAGRLYVLDSPANALVVLDLQGKVLKRVGDSRDNKRRVSFDHPSEIALASGVVAVLDAAGSRIQIFDLECNFLKAFRIRNVGRPPVRAEMGVALDSTGYIYVSNLGPLNVGVYRQDGELIRSFGRPGIMGIWIDSSDRIYAADTSNSRVLVFHPAGNVAKNRTAPAMPASRNRQ